MEFDDLDLSHLAVQGTTRFTLSLIKIHCDRSLVLVMKPASESNPEYKSARAKLIKELAAATQRNDADAIQAMNIKLFSSTVITGWENCQRPDGSPVPFSAANCAELLTKIDRVARDEVIPAFNYAMNPDNFRATPEAAATTLGK